jgi:hypothetical protein
VLWPQVVADGGAPSKNFPYFFQTIEEELHGTEKDPPHV